MRRILSLTVIAVMSLGIIAVSLNNVGTSDDPLVSVSYLEENIKAPALDLIEDYISDDFRKSSNDAEADINYIGSLQKYDVTEENIADMVADMLTREHEFAFSNLFIMESTITAEPGTTVMLSAGNATVKNSMIDISSGQTVPSGTALVAKRLYMFPENGRGSIYINTSSAAIFSDAQCIETPLRPAMYEDYADALADLNLFKGTDIGYELTRSANRGEALVMLIRLMGQEEEALSFTGSHPFSDVPSWLSPYVAFGYSKGYTTGMTAQIFGSSEPVTVEQNSTFVLRVLGYNDKAGDFDYYESPEFAREKGVLNSSSLAEIKNTGKLYRDHLVYMNYNALEAMLKDGSETLAEKLITDGIFSESDFEKTQNDLK